MTKSKCLLPLEENYVLEIILDNEITLKLYSMRL